MGDLLSFAPPRIIAAVFCKDIQRPGQLPFQVEGRFPYEVSMAHFGVPEQTLHAADRPCAGQFFRPGKFDKRIEAAAGDSPLTGWKGQGNDDSQVKISS